jgi:hypothetical protein
LETGIRGELNYSLVASEIEWGGMYSNYANHLCAFSGINLHSVSLQFTLVHSGSLLFIPLTLSQSHRGSYVSGFHHPIPLPPTGFHLSSSHFTLVFGYGIVKWSGGG